MKKVLVVTILLACLCACNTLDTEPHSLVPETFFNNEQELNDFLLGVYSPLMQEVMYGGGLMLSIGGGDDLGFYGRSNPSKCLLCANTNSSDQYISSLWKLLYEGVNRANMLLENVDKNNSINPAIRRRVAAEALFLRSFYYFLLVEGWGDVPLYLESTHSVLGLDVDRTDKQVVYDQLINDIEKALPDLNDFDQNITPELISKTAAAGILARVWMFRAGECFRDKQAPDDEHRKHCFAEAKKWCEYVVNSGIHGLVTPYSRVFMDLSEDKYNSTGIKESMWEAAEAGNRTTSESAAGRLGNTVGFGLTDSNIGITDHVDEGGLANPGYSYNFLITTLRLAEIYDSAGDTARADWSIAPFTYTVTTDKVTGLKSVTGRKWYYGKLPRDTAGNPIPAPAGYTYTEDTERNSKANRTRLCAKYRREYERVLPKHKTYTPINSPILRYADVLLMLAEAENEINGPTPLALSCLNQVRDRAMIYLIESASQEEFRTLIQNERAMELCFEGGLRRWDLIRWGIYSRTMLIMQGYSGRTGWASSYSYASKYYQVTDAYQYFPIPEKEMSLNKGIKKQNPGW